MGKATGFLELDRQVESYREVDIRINDYDEIFSGTHNLDQLQEQGSRCMDCGVPFCQSSTGCPIDNLIPEWNDLVYNNEWQEALERLEKTNNFPEFTGRVCPAPCEGSCVLGLNNPAVTIKNIELAIVDKGFEEGWIKPKLIESRTDKKVAVVGSGPAGLAAADELNQMGHSVMVYERSDRIGGLLMYGIPNMKLGKDVVDRRVDLLMQEGVEFMTNTDVGKDISTDELQNNFDAVVFTTGATKARDLPAENRNAKGIYPAMDYLTSNTKSLLDNGIADESQLSAKGKNVIVIGGGDTGTDCIGTSLRQGAKSIINFELMSQPPEHRSDTNPWPEWPVIFRVDYGHEESNKVFGNDPRRYQLLTKAFLKDSNGDVKGIKTINVDFVDGKLTEIDGTEKTWDAELVLLSMGFLSPEHYLSDDANIELDERGNYQSKHGEFNTSRKGVFSAGDCRRGQSLVVWAINEGRGVANSVNSFLLNS
ncbi:glutamate synthase [Candidatus Pseudothioglobus singularis]|jgi:glutamate synthase (NADPH/NADH) small chain|uniref:glutamate synthase subunit beta n=1 Tax=Candidatus Pseudothioglobus singularis TaxID=1427364 RepID=UPI00036A3E4C|nr:glutamate synthase subunit beta [Candidatus Pseudothioglobus singularis]ANQ66963.1 glutamate synthase [Candidatus Pseudothioglobus singularis]MDA7438003.1 glutamate synthase subunit beta [Candidatus Pseudothioglobus singularis]MDB4598063.1 glutamate synthase subunit beta [Candidatus Pseudothioglobus singularis]MDC1066039.1 glutamate synthase subunit beta [Candidatus Pseudothioglobus singularis]|tara:strand:+ start:1247 stop:2686 length:1440 start_codon:yes stop_codon:yes gene_type:complete